ncbi:MAG: hypothetical protein ACLT0Y_05435 [Christensenellales bacterium]
MNFCSGVAKADLLSSNGIVILLGMGGYGRWYEDFVLSLSACKEANQWDAKELVYDFLLFDTVVWLVSGAKRPKTIIGM